MAQTIELPQNCPWCKELLEKVPGRYFGCYNKSCDWMWGMSPTKELWLQRGKKD